MFATPFGRVWHLIEEKKKSCDQVNEYIIIFQVTTPLTKKMCTMRTVPEETSIFYLVCVLTGRVQQTFLLVLGSGLSRSEQVMNGSVSFEP